MVTNMWITLEEVLNTAESLPWDYSLYIPEVGFQWSKDAQVMVLNPEETEGEEDVPPEAKKNSLKFALTISETQDVVLNSREQDPGVDVDMLIMALKYYYENDAFLEFNDLEGNGV